MPVEEATMWTLFYMFLGSTVIAVVFIVLFVLIVLITPAATFLKAKLRHKPIIAARRRDRKVDHRCADEYIQGLVKSKEYGAFLVDSDSVYTDKKSGVPILPVNAEVGITLSPKILEMIDGMKRMGISNIEEAELINSLYGRCSCGYEGMMNPTEAVNDKDEKIIVLECPMKTDGGVK